MSNHLHTHSHTHTTALFIKPEDNIISYKGNIGLSPAQTQCKEMESFPTWLALLIQTENFHLASAQAELNLQ